MSSPKGRPHELAVMRGYRFDLAKRSMLIAIEVNYWLFSDDTDSGNSNFSQSSSNDFPTLRLKVPPNYHAATRLLSQQAVRRAL